MLYEVQGVGIQWDNVEQEATENFTFSWILYMMLIDSAIYFIIGWYFRQVIPGAHQIQVLQLPLPSPLKPSINEV